MQKSVAVCLRHSSKSLEKQAVSIYHSTARYHAQHPAHAQLIPPGWWALSAKTAGLSRPPLAQLCCSMASTASRPGMLLQLLIGIKWALALAAMCAAAAPGVDAATAAECNLTARYSYLPLLAPGQLLGTELMALPSRYISTEACPTVTGYFGNLSGWAPAPGMQQTMLLAVLAVVQQLAVHAVYSIGAASSSRPRAEAVAALLDQHEQRLQHLRTKHAAQLQQMQQLVHLPAFNEENDSEEAMQQVTAAKQAAAAAGQKAVAARDQVAAAAAAAGANRQQEAVHQFGGTAIAELRVAFTDQRLLAASKPGSFNIVELRQFKKRNACLKAVPTQSNQHVKRTREGVHAALQMRLEQWLQEQLLVVE